MTPPNPHPDHPKMSEQVRGGVAEVLERAADRLQHPGAWTQGVYARTTDGGSTQTQSANAVCWCAAGAIASVAGGLASPAYTDAIMKLCASLGRNIADFNDAPGRTQAEVVSALRSAAAAARAQVQA